VATLNARVAAGVVNTPEETAQLRADLERARADAGKAVEEKNALLGEKVTLYLSHNMMLILYDII
jgi:hypothetical protein